MQLVQQRIEAPRTQFAVVQTLVSQALAHEGAHARTNEPIRQPSALAALDEPAVTGVGRSLRR
jgi:hypothetical protein